MQKHFIACSKTTSKRSVENDQWNLRFQKVSKVSLPKGLDVATKLVYQDHIPMAIVAKSEAIQLMFSALNFSKVTYHSLNKAMDEKYQLIISEIKNTIQQRDSKQIQNISFDKWSSQDWKKIHCRFFI